MKSQQSSLKEKKEFSQLQIWLIAARPRALAISLTMVGVGSSLAYATIGHLDKSLVFFALLFSIFIQIGTHFINDALDFDKGVDGDLRCGFMKVAQLGLVSSRQMMIGGFICLGLAVASGVPLVIQGGWPLIFILVVCVANGYLYTGGPLPLSYTGLGDLFAFLFFGLTGTLVVYYLQTGYVDSKAVLAGAQLGLFATVMTATNNLRDIVSDAQSNKRTMAVRFGKTFARTEISLFALLPFALGLGWIGFGYPFAASLPFLGFPLACHVIDSIWKTEPSSRYNQLFVKCAALQFLFSCLLMIGLLMS